MKKFVALAIALALICNLQLAMPASAASQKLNAALVQAASDDDPEQVRDLLEQGADVNARDSNSNGWTSLMWAAICDEEEVARILLEYNADVNMRSSNDGSTALILAGQSNSVEIARMLIERGADIHAKGDHGQTALTNAVSHANAGVTKLLLESGMTPDEINAAISAEPYSVEVARMLIEHGADVNHKNEYGNTPLMDAKELDIAELMIRSGADVNAKNNEGYTALIMASGNGWTDMVKLLLNNGANVKIKANDGMTALKLAKKNNHQFVPRWGDVDTTEIIKMLRARGAK